MARRSWLFGFGLFGLGACPQPLVLTVPPAQSSMSEPVLDQVPAPAIAEPTGAPMLSRQAGLPSRTGSDPAFPVLQSTITGEAPAALPPEFAPMPLAPLGATPPAMP